MIKVGLVGAGYWGKNLIRNFMDSKECILDFICDINEDRLKRVKKRYPDLKTTSDYLSIINDKSIDGVAIATNVNSHYNLER